MRSSNEILTHKVPSFLQDYCKIHPNLQQKYICICPECQQYLNLLCSQCNQNHAHKCQQSSKFVIQLYKQNIKQLSFCSKQKFNHMKSLLTEGIEMIQNLIELWYSPIQSTATQKEVVNTLENPSKLMRIRQAGMMKDLIIQTKMQKIQKYFMRELQLMTDEVTKSIQCLEYKIITQNWKFDEQNTNQLLKISGWKNRTLDKKSHTEKYCMSLLNQPLTPFHSQVTFTVNSQNINNRSIVIGVCSKQAALKTHYETDLIKGVYGIYQASTSGSTNNAYALHDSDPYFQYKEVVGWNFGTGDSVIMALHLEKNKISIKFSKKGKQVQKQEFEMRMGKAECILYPFIGLFSSGDKVSIDGN